MPVVLELHEMLIIRHVSSVDVQFITIGGRFTELDVGEFEG